MIVYPKDRKEVGQEIQVKQIEETLLNVLSEIDCNCLSFSGGIDSTIMLYLMRKKYTLPIQLFTIGLSEDHPDVKFARMISKELSIKHNVYIPNKKDIENEGKEGDFLGDNAVRLFYKYISNFTNDIIACDGIDEFMCGYYDHLDNPNSETYYSYLRNLQTKHLEPLNKNSKKVKVYLPYVDSKLICLYSQIPIEDKIRDNYRKKVMIDIAIKLGVPKKIINRRKYGFCDAFRIKERNNEDEKNNSNN